MGMVARANDIKGRSKHKLGHIDIRKRCSELVDLEGWYQVDFDHSVLPEEILPYYMKWKDEFQRVKFTRWLNRLKDDSGKKLFDNSQLSMLGEVIGKQKGISFKVSARKNDILRTPESLHYFSCFSGDNVREWARKNQGRSYGGSGWRGVQMLRYIADPEIGVVYIPDAAGHFLWRAYIRLCLTPDHTLGWAIYRSYGNPPVSELLIEDKLNELLPLYKLTTAGYIHERHITPSTLTSVHTYNNPIVGKTIWSDHGMEFHVSTRKLQFKGVPLRVDRGK